jgi:hypothetical protein
MFSFLHRTKPARRATGQKAISRKPRLEVLEDRLALSPITVPILPDFNQTGSLSHVVHLGDNPNDTRFLPPNPSGTTLTLTFTLPQGLVPGSASIEIDQYQADNSVPEQRSFVTLNGSFLGRFTRNSFITDLTGSSTLPVLTDVFPFDTALLTISNTLVVQAGDVRIGPPDTFDDFCVTNIRLQAAIEQPDLVASSLTWNTTLGGADFTYQITGADLTQDTTAMFYWATGTTTDTILERATTPIPISMTTPLDQPVTVHLAPDDFPGGAPTGARYLLAVVDPDNLIDESEEGNNVSFVGLRDIVMQWATAENAQSVTFQYEIKDEDLSQPIVFTVYRSNSDPSSAIAITSPITVTPDQLDLDGQPATARGVHRITVDASLPIIASLPYVIVQADTLDAIAEYDEANNTAFFRKYIVGAVTHGYESFFLGFPDWVNEVAATLHLGTGYDAVIAFDWSFTSGVSAPGFAVSAGHELAAQVRQVAESLGIGTYDVIDMHFIGHSRGAVVISQALQDLEAESSPQLRSGYVKMTMLDPHPARNYDDAVFYSAHPILGLEVVETFVTRFQDEAQDPGIVIPNNVSEAEVYFQHTLWDAVSPLSPEGLFNLNLWGENNFGGATEYDLTDVSPGITHTGVHIWYLDHIIPTLL